MGKSGRTLFERPMPTVGCSADGRKRRRRRRSVRPKHVVIFINKIMTEI